MVSLILLIASMVAQLALVYFLLRVCDLYVYRMDMLDDIFEHSDVDWRLHEARKVSNTKMLFFFWRKFDDFFPNKNFLK